MSRRLLMTSRAVASRPTGTDATGAERRDRLGLDVGGARPWRPPRRTRTRTARRSRSSRRGASRRCRTSPRRSPPRRRPAARGRRPPRSPARRCPRPRTTATPPASRRRAAGVPTPRGGPVRPGAPGHRCPGRRRCSRWRSWCRSAGAAPRRPPRALARRTRRPHRRRRRCRRGRARPPPAACEDERRRARRATLRKLGQRRGWSWRPSLTRGVPTLPPMARLVVLDAVGDRLRHRPAARVG